MKKLLCLMPLLLVACKGEPSLSDICTDNAEFCTDLNADGWCRHERADLIRQRYKVATDKGSDHDYQQYRLLRSTEDYRDCMAKAIGVVHKNLKERQSDRGTAYINSLVALKALEAETKNSSEPHLLYYRYTRLGDDEALQQFLALEGSGAFNTLELKAMLAGYYAKSDRAKTAKLLLEGLALPREDDNINPEIYQTLATLSQQLHHFKEAYLWSLVAKGNDVAIDTHALESILLKDPQVLASIQEKAEEVASAIKKGQFKVAMAQLDSQG
ncbi:DUF2989 domain-containing protein [Gallaecimonas kandeliae]|uniref:DUF2989 domain-containing protein n=1 Tax=Gallaecimonas kandeliae TaxID=3029055 RepID=UPI002647A3B1|nr:DUF2989 domain-containing protein [Gallaecimonas kandeliae]WKE67176.1 DUF2989 domain-containing protein [Gallaecimonas kandeliae]